MHNDQILNILGEISHRCRERAAKMLLEPKWAGITGRGAGGDETREFDLVMEREIIDGLEALDNIRIVSEESGAMDIGDPEIAAYVDPLDGSRNAVRGIPLFSLSIAVGPLDSALGQVELGLVANLMVEETFHAVKGEGAFRNGRPIEIKRKDNENIGILAMEGSPCPAKAVERNTGLIKRAESVRDLGSIALDLCYLGIGAVDVLTDLRGGICRTLDIAAGYLVAKECGRVITGGEGKGMGGLKIGPRTRTDMVGSRNPRLHERVLSHLGRPS